MVVFCPGCGSRISVEPASPGGDVECPRCHSTFPTAGVKDAGNAPQPKRFRPKKAGGGKLAAAGIVFAVLLVMAGGAAGVLYYTGVLNRWFGGSPAASSSGGAVVQPTWQEYINADAKFRVLFPGTPTRDTIPPPSKLKAGAKPRIVSFTAETPDVTYSVIHEDFDTKSDSPEQALDKHRADMAAGRGGKLVSEKDVVSGTYKGKEFVVEAPNRGTAHIRYFPVGRRLYKVMALGTQRPPEASEVAKFFDSFQITS
jgi:hypothetical protein